MKTWRFLPALLLFLSPSVRAQEAPLGGFAFLRLPFSARIAALGETPAAVSDDDVALFLLNPASLQPEQHRHLQIAYLNHVGDIRAGLIASAWHREGLGTFGLALRFLDWGVLNEADLEGNRKGTFRPVDLALTVGLGRSRDPSFHYGASFHLIHTALADRRATAFALDAGLRYELPMQLLTLAGSLHYLGVTLQSLGTTPDRLPFDMRLALRKRLRYLPLQFTVTVYDLLRFGRYPENQTWLGRLFYYLNFGAELGASRSFQLRFGYSYRRHEMLKIRPRLDLAGFNAGFGLRMAGLHFDYAFSSWSSLGLLHYLTVQTRL
ncbi:MAG: PorV/PorQ family protein [Rhodothermus sp.]|nr:PorV/PorQ family protein [Rhodothermus sp.]